MPVESSEVVKDVLFAATKSGRSVLPDSTDPKVKQAAQLCIERSITWLIRHLEPESLVVLVESEAKATAKIKWSDQ